MSGTSASTSTTSTTSTTGAIRPATARSGPGAPPAGPGTDVASFADGLSVTFERRGSGRPVLLLHGGGGPRTVAAFAGTLARYADVITPTHPGFGGTARPDWFDSVDDLALTYLELLERLDLHDVLVIGSSMGGWIASEMAVRDTGRIGGVVLVNAIGIQVPGESVADVFALTPAELSALSFHDPGAHAVDPTTLGPEQRAAIAANFRALAVYGRDRGMRDPKLRRRLARVAVPALVVWGLSDGVAGPAYGRAFAEAFADGRFEPVAECGHLPQIEQPGRLLDLVLGFGAGGAAR
ncbi:alpha/beta fold hydrolase [Kitasatospora sp. NBC_00315]|uniref:alpha/beta fold hydrolase n=1 Tax=Kitasatospora sp. NBC_00315 TaxID=2975963 RepID=UPI003255BAF1